MNATTVDLAPDQITAAVRAFGRENGRQGQRKFRRRFLATVDRETPGLPEDERAARAHQKFLEYMRAMVAAREANRNN